MQGMKISEQNNTLEITIIKGKERETSTYVTTAEHYSADYLQNGKLSPVRSQNNVQRWCLLGHVHIVIIYSIKALQD